MKRQWWRQKFSTAIASAIIFVAVNVHFTDQNLEVYFWSNSNKSTDHYFSSIRAGRTKLKVRGQTVSKEVPTWLFVSKSSGFFNVYYAVMIWFLSSQVLYLFKFYPLGKIGRRGGVGG